MISKPDFKIKSTYISRRRLDENYEYNNIKTRFLIPTDSNLKLSII